MQEFYPTAQNYYFNEYPPAMEEVKYPVATEQIYYGEQTPQNAIPKDETREIQEYLNQNHDARLIVDGIFGESTQYAIIPLKRGQQSRLVYLLQSLLNKCGYTVKLDGFFGSQTEARIRAFQNDRNLTIDGIAGRKTFCELLK
jgi:peptidoglycan hydrolase-like protein with peptidoglycan-binding domain